MSTEYAFQSTDKGGWDKNNKNPLAITCNNCLAAQNFLKKIEKKYKVQKGRESLISLYRRNTKLALLAYQQWHSDTSLFWKSLLQTALPNNKLLMYLLLLLPLSLKKKYTVKLSIQLLMPFYSYTEILKYSFSRENKYLSKQHT